MTPLEQKIYNIVRSPRIETTHKPRLIMNAVKELGENVPVWDLEQFSFCLTALHQYVTNGAKTITMTNVSKNDLVMMSKAMEFYWKMGEANFNQLRESVDKLYKLLSEKNYSKK